MQSIFQISSQYQALMDHISEKEELDNDLLSELDSINDSLENKILNYASIIKNMDFKVHCIEEAMLGMEKRMNSLVNASNRLKEIVKIEMERCDKKKIENQYHEVSVILNNPKVNIIDLQKIPEVFKRTKIKETIEPDKAAISFSIKNGGLVPGAELVRDSRINIK